jgi:hypothetical protein
LTQQEFNIGSGRGFAKDDDDADHHHDHEHAIVCGVLHSGMAVHRRQQMQILLKYFFWYPPTAFVDQCIYLFICIVAPCLLNSKTGHSPTNALFDQF